MRHRQVSRASARLMVQNEMKWLLDHGKNHSYLEPWQRMPVDPAIEHIVTIELEDAQKSFTKKRVTCTCGLDRGWQSPLDASQDASWHRDHVMRMKHERDLDDIPIAVVERKREPAAFRWCCDLCPARGNWLAIEVIAAVGSILHADACPNKHTSHAARNGGRHHV